MHERVIGWDRTHSSSLMQLLWFRTSQTLRIGKIYPICILMKFISNYYYYFPLQCHFCLPTYLHKYSPSKMYTNLFINEPVSILDLLSWSDRNRETQIIFMSTMKAPPMQTPGKWRLSIKIPDLWLLKSMDYSSFLIHSILQLFLPRFMAFAEALVHPQCAVLNWKEESSSSRKRRSASKGSKFIWFFNVTRDNSTCEFTTSNPALH